MRLEPGTVFAKDYQVVSPLSQGGMGTIYIVQQLSTGRQRALKLMLPEFVQNAALRARFEQEAKVAARIESDHVVQVIAAGIDDASGCPWLAMELLKGHTLEQRVQSKGLLNPVEMGTIVTQLVHGLRAAHAVSVVHRDLKPENIFLADVAREGGTSLVKILDFGIARISAEAKATKTAAMGTPLWMAPEQSKAGSEIGPRTDIWALGLIVYWMVTGKEYWLSASSPEVTALMLMNEVLMQPLEPATQRASTLGGRPVPEGFDAWFSRCVNRDISQRFPDVDSALRELVPLLQRMHEGVGVPAHSPSIEGFLGQAPASAYQPPSEMASRASEPHAAPQRPSGTLIGAPLNLPPDFIGQAPQTPYPGGVDMRTSSPSYPNAPSYAQPADTRGPYAGQTAGGPFHAPTGAPLTTSSPNAPVPPKPSKAPLIALAVVGGLAVLGGGGYGISRLVAGKTTKTTTTECSAKDLDACEKACNDARDNDGDAATACASYAHALIEKGNVEKAIPVLQQSCDDKAGATCDELGAIYAFSSKTARNGKKATSLFQRACDAGVGAGCAHSGAVVELGWMDGGAAKAVPLYQKACDKGEGRACLYLAEAMSAGRGATPDAAKADELRKKGRADLEKRCKGDGDPEACALAGVVSERTGDFGGARTNYRSACDAGDSLGCNNLARLDAEGIGGPADAEGALKRFADLCAKGDAGACNNAGILESRWSAQLRYGPRGEAVYKFKCAQAMSTGCAGWGEGKIIGGGTGDLTKAVDSLTKACDQGLNTACVNLGGLLFIGQGAKKDRVHAHELFNKACTAGEPTGCGEAGSLYFVDYAEQPADPPKALELLQRACDGGELDACSLVLHQKIYGIGTAKSVGDALTGLKRYCEEKKISQSCTGYADALLADAREKKDAAAIQAQTDQAKKLYTDVCESTGEGCAALGEIFYANDAKTQFTLFQKGCDKGQFDACSDLAAAYEDGHGVEKNVKTAQQIFDKACQRGHAASCGRLAVFYLEGTSKEDAKKGADLSKEACDDGDPRGCGNYGTCLVFGTGVDAKPAAAVPYLKRACNQGIQNACDTLQTIPH